MLLVLTRHVSRPHSAGRRIAIEVDGPFHFPINARTPLGHTMIRRRMLRAGGWTVLSIPWYEWYALESWEGRLPYLADVLASGDSSLAAELQQASGKQSVSGSVFQALP